MSTPLKTVRGTHDLLPDDCARHQHVIGTARAKAALYGFREMATPIFEFSDVFSRTLGDASDIVTKEMYNFQDKGGDWLTLRPEGTAGIARAYISEGLSQISPFKIFYQGPMFRYERPQKGRQRQFHQIGVELLGVSSHLADLECIGVADDILKALDIRGKARLEINSIGDKESRDRYRGQLREFLSGKILSEESQKRLVKNPLRILDSKDPVDQKALAGAPELSSCLSGAAADMFAAVQDGLKGLGIEFAINPKLVRGLDYYSHLVFEYRTSELGAQDAIIAGGRYDELIEIMGGPATPGFGWAAGIERLVLLLNQDLAAPRPVALVPMGPEGEAEALKIAHELRQAGIYSEITMSGNMSKRMKKAAGMNARWAIIVGGDELKENKVALKDMDAGTQELVGRSGLAGRLR
jgi:histidyl-tRNA synthetase